MCRSSHFQNSRPQSRNTLMIKAFFVRFSSLQPRKSLPDSLTLLFLPRINGAELLIDGSKVRPDSSAFVTLHRVVNVKTKAGEAIFGSRSRVSAAGGIRFEVFTRDDKILEGIFRKDGEEEWRLECECGVESEKDGGAVAVAEVCVAVEGQGKGHTALSGRVEMASKKKKTRKGRLEVIPEENEEAAEEEEEEEDCCGCEYGNIGSDGGDSGEVCGPGCDMMDMDMEGVRWAVDLGVWVMCFGVGYLVSKASARSLRRLRLF
ncbi:uncharacterized protein [Euphorbia lathyris]|uniref:uncharacterized protein n=1 Tax=Euphorbia lathyris TaxID=212925 RepID=UPI0033135953